MELAVLGMQIMQSQMAKLLQEKENVKEFHLKSQKRIKDLSSEVLRLNSQIIEKERSYEAKLKELNTKIQEQDASFISWNEEKEVIIERPSCSLHKSILFLKSCGLMNNNIFPFS
jgi:kinesin family protein 15